LTDDSIDDLGPVDYLVVEFPADRANFTGEMASELTALVDAGTIRVLDLLILQKDADGAIEALEIDDVDGLDDIRRFESDIAEILAADDVADLAASMEELLGGAVRLRCPPRRRSAGRQRPYPDSSDRGPD
jgi:hypothetical protein